MHNFTNLEFIGYLEMLATDTRESGSEAMADDLDECANRLLFLLDTIDDLCDFCSDMKRRTI